MQKIRFLIVGIIVAMIFPWLYSELVTGVLPTMPYIYPFYILNVLVASLLGLLYWKLNGKPWHVIFVILFLFAFKLLHSYQGFLLEKNSSGFYPDVVPENDRATNYNSYWNYIKYSHMTIKGLIIVYTKKGTIWILAIFVSQFILKKTIKKKMQRNPEIIDG